MKMKKFPYPNKAKKSKAGPMAKGVTPATKLAKKNVSGGATKKKATSIKGDTMKGFRNTQQQGLTDIGAIPGISDHPAMVMAARHKKYNKMRKGGK